MFYFLSLGSALFAIGFFGFIAHQSARGKLISLFVILNAIVINLAAFDKFIKSGPPNSSTFLFFVLIIVSALFLSIALILRLNRKRFQNERSDSLEILN
jgi:NADH:ubiquinone oxidoreductase subunit K